ncbi:hypothetical protein DFH06DRAFT_1139072 [Mycena polygramma]|nr:hypothetical protein DFH06DRAFT_1139072 [Mycena polygramma]
MTTANPAPTAYRPANSVVSQRGERFTAMDDVLLELLHRHTGLQRGEDYAHLNFPFAFSMPPKRDVADELSTPLAYTIDSVAYIAYTHAFPDIPSANETTSQLVRIITDGERHVTDGEGAERACALSALGRARLGTPSISRASLVLVREFLTKTARGYRASTRASRMYRNLLSLKRGRMSSTLVRPQVLPETWDCYMPECYAPLVLPDTFVIPTFHNIAHRSPCSFPSSHVLPHDFDGLTDGEGVEKHFWSQGVDGEPLELAWALSGPIIESAWPLGPLASSTRYNGIRYSFVNLVLSIDRNLTNLWLIQVKYCETLSGDRKRPAETPLFFGNYMIYAGVLNRRTGQKPTAGRRRCTPAQLAAMRAYRERNKEQLQARARERMARRRELLMGGDRDSQEQFKAQARAASQRHRERHADLLANNQRVRRAENFIKKFGMDAWSAAYDERYIKEHGQESWIARFTERVAEPITDAEISATSPHDPDYELHDFLDNRDPTTRPDYVPKPGERRYFQRGKYRWY